MSNESIQIAGAIARAKHNIAARRADIHQLEAALAEAHARIADMWQGLTYCVHQVPELGSVPGIEAILSRPADYSALPEALARECERLADFAKSKSDLGSWWDMVEAWLRTEAAAHRGNK